MKKHHLVIPLLFLFLFAFEGCSLINSVSGFNGRKYRPGIYRHDQAKVEGKAGEQSKIIPPHDELEVTEELQEDNSAVTAGLDSQIIVIANPLRQAICTSEEKDTGGN